jgi:hypothetical protein
VDIVLVVLMVPIAILCVLNLALVLAVIRQLRVHTSALAALGQRAVEPDSGLAPGTPVPPLAATTEDGVELSPDTLGSGEKVLAFVSATCAGCREHLPGFVTAARVAYPPDDVVVVVSGDRPLGDDLVGAARGVAHVLVEPDDGRWTTGFGIRAFPTFVRVRGGVVAAKGPLVSDVVRLQPA